jgi:ABC-2 type transport system permease protein
MRGTGTLLRLTLRLDRVRLAVWITLLSLTPLATAAQYQKTYPTPESLDVVRGVASNTSLVALNGPMFQVSIGGLTAWKIGITEIILVALMSILTVVRHTRNEEEVGRAELLGAGVVGRYALLTAAMLEMVLANVVIAALTALFVIGVGLPAAGSVALGLLIAFSGILFAAVAAVAAQLTQAARAASGIAIAVLGGAYLLRVIGDTGPTWLSWISPVGWALFFKPYASNAFWVSGLFVVLIAVLLVVAYALVGQRDVGRGLVPDRPAAAQAAPSLRSSFALAWRLHRGSLLGWTIGLAVSGLVFGGAGNGLRNLTTDNQQLLDMLSRLGGPGGFVDQFFGACYAIIGVTAAGYTVATTLRLRTEESAGLVEPLLATKVGRTRWAFSHLVFALGGTGVVLAMAGLFGGLAYGAAIGDMTQVGRLLAAAIVQLPAAWVLAGLGVLLFGFVPRLTAVAWAGLVVAVLVLLLGGLLGLNQYVMDVSPFTHIPKLPGAAFTAAPLVWLTLVAALLGGVGLAGFRRRNLPSA